MFCTKCGSFYPDGGECPTCNPLVSEAVTDESVYTPEEPVKNPGKTLGIVALILGIVSLVLGVPCSCACACLGSILPIGCAIGGIVTGALGMNKSKAAGFKNTLALVGLILSIVAVVICVVFIIVNAVAGGMMGAAEANSYNSYFNY